MEQTDTGARLRTRTIVVALLAGLAVVLLLFPGSGIDRQPPECYSMFGYVVPCDAWVAWAVGAATAAVVGLALWMIDRGRSPSRSR
jgi:hypothetical protein